MEKKNVFVMGLNDFNRKELESVRSREKYHFHPLLSSEELINLEKFPIKDILDKARKTLDDFHGTIHGIFGFWDFPVTTLVPILCDEYGLPGPSIESVFKCAHKYWSRVEQKKVIPECTPKFCAVNPFDDNALDKIELHFPFWLKPVKAYASFLGFKIHTPEEFHQAMKKIQKEIKKIGEPFNYLLSFADLPSEIRDIGGNFCIAEEIIDGFELAPEGFVQNEDIHMHGVIDCFRDKFEKSFQSWEYPSTACSMIQERVKEKTRKVLRQIGLNDGCFNVEFFWDRAPDKLWIVEINPRISQSHAYQFEMVDGASNHDVALCVAVGIPPEFPHREGKYNSAAKFVLRKYEDARVTRIPSDGELEEIKKDFPDAMIQIKVEEGMYLHDLSYQDNFSYTLANIYLAARNHETLWKKYENFVNRLRFEFTDERFV
jgi:biotin carboxylase